MALALYEDDRRRPAVHGMLPLDRTPPSRELRELHILGYRQIVDAVQCQDPHRSVTALEAAQALVELMDGRDTQTSVAVMRLAVRFMLRRDRDVSDIKDAVLDDLRLGAISDAEPEICVLLADWLLHNTEIEWPASFVDTSVMLRSLRPEDEAIAQALDALVTIMSDDWTGAVGPGFDPFVSLWAKTHIALLLFLRDCRRAPSDLLAFVTSSCMMLAEQLAGQPGLLRVALGYIDLAASFSSSSAPASGAGPDLAAYVQEALPQADALRRAIISAQEPLCDSDMHRLFAVCSAASAPVEQSALCKTWAVRQLGIAPAAALWWLGKGGCTERANATCCKLVGDAFFALRHGSTQAAWSVLQAPAAALRNPTAGQLPQAVLLLHTFMKLMHNLETVEPLHRDSSALAACMDLAQSMLLGPACLDKRVWPSVFNLLSGAARLLLPQPPKPIPRLSRNACAAVLRCLEQLESMRDFCLVSHGRDAHPTPFGMDAYVSVGEFNVDEARRLLLIAMTCSQVTAPTPQAVPRALAGRAAPPAFAPLLQSAQM